MWSRKQKACTVSDKVNAVEHVDKGKSQAKVSHDLGVTEPTLAEGQGEIARIPTHGRGK